MYAFAVIHINLEHNYKDEFNREIPATCIDHNLRSWLSIHVGLLLTKLPTPLINGDLCWFGSLCSRFSSLKFYKVLLFPNMNWSLTSITPVGEQCKECSIFKIDANVRKKPVNKTVTESNYTISLFFEDQYVCKISALFP